MTNSDNTPWWNHWWKQTEKAVVPWCIGAMAVLFAIALGVAAAIQALELQDHHLIVPTDPKGPTWADIITAFSTFVLAIAAVLALRSISEAKNARTALQMNELSRRWDEQANLEVRRKALHYAKNGLPRRLLRSPRRFGVGASTTALPGPDRLKDCMLKLKEENDPEYRELLTEPDFLEDLAILIDRGGIGFEIVNQSLGSVIAYLWSLWKPTVYELRRQRKEPLTFIEFEKLAKQIAKANPQSVKMDAVGEIIWDGFRQ